MVLDRIQQHLEAIYGTACELKVSDFLVGEDAAKALGAARESLFVREQEDALELKVYVSPEILGQLESVALPAAVLQWQGGAGAARTLHTRLFDEVRFAPQWGEDERWRYEEANRLARSYCAGLLRHITARRMDALLSELRHSYRM